MYQKQDCRYGVEKRDYGGQPFVVNMEGAAKGNTNYRTALWTGKYLQVTLMSIPVGESIGVEVHEDTDQFIRIEEGCGTVQFGETRGTLRDVERVDKRSAIMIPAGTWHNIVNCGYVPLKLYSVYAPPHHPFGTVQKAAPIPETYEP